MKAVKFVGVGKEPEVIETEVPTPKPGEILVKIGGAGVCHSDLHVLHQGIGIDRSFTLGHENAGWVEAVGDGVTQWKKGDAVAIYGPWGCGHCHACMESFENYCENWSPGKSYGGGLGEDGGMANYMIVPSPRLLVPLGTLDPRDAAPLSDAALTPYHAIKRALPLLTPDSTAVVLGVGGLGHMAVQILKAVSGARIVAADVSESKLDLARQHGADLVVNSSDKDVVNKILKFTGNRKAQLVLDCVGVQPTVDLGAQLLGFDSHWTIVGMGGGQFQWQAMATPFASMLNMPYWGSRTELMEVLKLAESGKIKAHTTHYSIDDIQGVYKDLEAGKIDGRAVIIPNP